MQDQVGNRSCLRILAFIALPFSETYGFWDRDIGLAVLKMREWGHDAKLIAFKTENAPHPGSPVLLASREDLENPAWWREQAPDAIILNAWSAPRWHAIRAAAASLGKPMVEKLDSDGVKSPRIWFRNALEQNWSKYQTTDPFYKKAKVIASGLARTLLVWSLPAVMDKKIVRTMSLVPVFAAETPVASERVRRFLRFYHASPMPRVVTIPHPTNTKYMGFHPENAKENLLVCVGRWRAANKGWPLAFAAVKKFLRLRPDWKFMLMGAEPALSEGMRREIDLFQGRFEIVGKRSPLELADIYRRARIYLFPSRWETFNIAAAEALCCGCSVVGPTQLASVSYFTSFRSGTPSHVRSADHLVDALLTEVHEWANGQRDPVAMSETAISLFGVERVAGQFLDIFNNWEAVAPESDPHPI